MEEVTRLVSTGDCVKIWDADSMTPLEQFNPHSSSHPVAQACWSSNNQYLVSASSSGDKLVLSSLKSTPVRLLELGDGKRQTRVCLSSSSQFLVSGGLDHCVHIWDLKSKRLHRSLKDHKEEVTCVSFNSNDSCIVSGSTSGDLVLHSLTTNVSSKAFGHGSNQPVHDLRLSTLKRSMLGSVSDSGTMVLWDSNTQKEIHMFDGAHKAPGTGLAFSPSSDLLVVSAGLDKKIVCYDTSSRIILRGIRVDNPLTSVDFTLDGTGLVVGSTQGKIYHFDLRNSSTPTKITIAHKTSVTCLRFQSNISRHKSSKLGSTKVSSTKRSTSKLSSSQPDGSTDLSPHRQPTDTGGVAMTSREAEGRQGAEQQPEKFSAVGRNSLDVFSPPREDQSPVKRGGNSDTPTGKLQLTNCEMLSREGEGQQLKGRDSLDVFSPVREDSHSGGSSQRKTPLGTQLAPTGRCYSPLSTFQSPVSIKEEEPIPAAASERHDTRKFNKTSSPSPEKAGQTIASKSQQASPSQQAPPFFTPEAGPWKANGIQAQLSYDSPVCEAQPNNAAGAASAAEALSSTLSQNVADMVGLGGAAPLTSLQIHFIQKMIQEAMEEFRDACHQDILNLQVEMIRQFYIQLTEIHGLINHYSVNTQSLVEEIEKLREENRQLKTNY